LIGKEKLFENPVALFCQAMEMTPPHTPFYEGFFMNIAEEFVIHGKVSFCRKRLLAYKHGNFMAADN